MTIPYNTAGQAAFDVFYKVAAKLYAAAQETTNEYIAQNYPGSRTMGESHADGRYRRVIQFGAGESRTVSYDYRTKAIETA